MTTSILIIVMPLALMLLIAIAYLAKRRTNPEEAEQKPLNSTPVTLDRNPNMPKMPGSTS